MDGLPAKTGKPKSSQYDSVVPTYFSQSNDSGHPVQVDCPLDSVWVAGVQATGHGHVRKVDKVGNRQAGTGTKRSASDANKYMSHDDATSYGSKKRKLDHYHGEGTSNKVPPSGSIKVAVVNIDTQSTTPPTTAKPICRTGKEKPNSNTFGHILTEVRNGSNAGTAASTAPQATAQPVSRKGKEKPNSNTFGYIFADAPDAQKVDKVTAVLSGGKENTPMDTGEGETDDHSSYYSPRFL